MTAVRRRSARCRPRRPRGWRADRRGRGRAARRAASGATSRQRRGSRRVPNVPDHRDADRARVEAADVRADDVPVDAAVAALVDRAVAVDEEVVADVVPAVRLDVVDLDPAHDRRRLRRRVAVGAGRVVDAREPDARRVGRLAAADRLVGAPGAARHDRRRPRRGDGAQRDLHLGAANERRPEIGDAAARCASGSRSTARPTSGHRRASRGSRPPRGRRRPAGRPPPRRIEPRAPAPRSRADAEVNRAAPVPAQRRRGRSGRARPRRATRSPCNGTDRNVIDARPAAAVAGSASAARAAMRARSGFTELRVTAGFQGDGRHPRSQGIRPHPDRILTVVRLPHLRGFCSRPRSRPRPLAGAAAGSDRGSTRARRGPRQRHQPCHARTSSRIRCAAPRGRLRRARRRARHARRPRQLDAQHRQDLPRTPMSRSSSTSARAARAQTPPER